MNHLCENQGMYDYDRRPVRVAASDTPIFDKLFKDSDKIERILTTASNKTTKLADKVEKQSSGGHGGYSFKPETFALLGDMLDAAYPAFDPFRPLLSKGQGELAHIDEQLAGRDPENHPLARYAKSLLDGIKDMDKSYNAVAQAKQDQDGDSVTQVSHNLAMSVTFMKSLFLQFVREAKAQGYDPKKMTVR